MKASDNGLDLLTLTESATELRISKPTLYRLLNSGDLAAVKIRGRTFVERDDLRRFVAKHRTSRGSP